MKLTTKQTLALPLLASGMSGVETAKATGIHSTTISEWLNNDAYFISEVERFREKATSNALAQLQATLTDAVNEMRRLVTSAESESVRLRAAEFVITNIGLAKMDMNNEKSINAKSNERIDLNMVLAGLRIKNE